MTSAAGVMKPVSDIAIKDMTESLKEADPDFSPEAIAAATDETLKVVEEHTKEFQERIYPVYDRLFSGEDVKELLRFYKSPAGQKMVQALPTLTVEGLAAGKEMTKTLYPKITQRVMGA